MDSVVFIVLNEAIEVHIDQVRRYGGHPGIRDIGLLLSALAMPQASFGGELLHRDIFEAAAARLQILRT
jgi:death-on-curing protein